MGHGLLSERAKSALIFSALVLLFTALNWLGTDLYLRVGGISTVKPFSGVALAICLIWGRRALWPVLISGIVGGIIAKQLFPYFTTFDTFFTPCLVTLAVLVVHTLTHRFVSKKPDFRSWKQLVGFIAISAVVSAVSGIIFAESRGAFLSPMFIANFRSWFAPTTLSYVIFTPLIVLLATAGKDKLHASTQRLAGSMAILLAAMGVTFLPTPVPLLFIIPLALLVVTMVSEIEGAAMGLAATQVVYTTAIICGFSPSGLEHLPMGGQLQMSQGFLGILITVLLPAAAAVTERTRLQTRLVESLRRESKINLALRDSERRYREMAEREQSASRAKSEFLANMSHELRTPLNAILGFSEVIKAELYGPLGHGKYREYAEDVFKSGAHLLDLINDVLDLSKIDAGKMELKETVFDLHEMVGETMLLLRGKARDHCELRVDLPDGLPAISADKRLVKQVLLNLLSNAVKFTPPGGTISVGARDTGETGLSITVSDTGLGMTAQEIEIAFSHYGQVDSKIARQHHGTGLGLPISRALAELHGGSLTAQSHKGHGTTMSLWLPESRMRRPEPAITAPELAQAV